MRIKSHVPLSRIFDEYRQKHPEYALSFTHAGQVLQGKHNAAHYNLQSGSTIGVRQRVAVSVD